MSLQTKFSILLPLAGLLSCSVPPPTSAEGENKSMSSDDLVAREASGSRFLLSETEIADKIQLFKEGDSDAALDLAQHYSFIAKTKEEKQKSLIWLKKSESLGGEVAARQIIIFFLYSDPSTEKCVKARVQLKKYDELYSVNEENMKDFQSQIDFCERRLRTG